MLAWMLCSSVISDGVNRIYVNLCARYRLCEVDNCGAFSSRNLQVYFLYYNIGSNREIYRGVRLYAVVTRRDSERDALLRYVIRSYLCMRLMVTLKRSYGDLSCEDLDRELAVGFACANVLARMERRTGVNAT